MINSLASSKLKTQFYIARKNAAPY